MNELVKVTEQEGKQLVDARELWQSLESKQDFSNWVKNKVIANPFFTENEDFLLLNNSIDAKTVQHRGIKVKIEYALTLDTAKKVAI